MATRPTSRPSRRRLGRANIDYAMDLGFGERRTIFGQPDPDHISTTFVERQNLTMRMGMRRFTRLTNGFSKKFERHAAMVCLFFLYCNFCRVHGSVRVTPAMEAGIDPVAHDVDWIAGLIEESYPPPGPRGPYRPRKNNTTSYATPVSRFASGSRRSGARGRKWGARQKVATRAACAMDWRWRVKNLIFN